MTDKLKKQLDFLIEADKMKTVLRQTMLMDKSRQETDAEHSWHFALTALTLYEYAGEELFVRSQKNETSNCLPTQPANSETEHCDYAEKLHATGSVGINIDRVIRMAILHDMVEIYAGDTFAYDTGGNMDKEERECEAADRLFALLPESQAFEYRSLWEEFDKMETPDALYASAVDRLQPFISNWMTEGHTWVKHGVTAGKIYQRMQPVKNALPELWEFVEHVIRESCDKGYIPPKDIKIKAIVTDLDETLLRSDKTVSEYTASVLDKCRKSGIKLIYATARPVRTLKDVASLPCCDAVIYHNGGVIHVDGKECFTFSIDNTAAKKLMAEILEKWPGLPVSAELNDTLYANFDVTKLWGNTEAVMTDLSDLPDTAVDKIILRTDEADVAEKISEMLPDELYMQKSGNQLWLIMHKNATKLNGVKAVLAGWGISPYEAVAFGDDYNDTELLQGCGVGVAVANAIDEAKCAADYICGDNDSDGMAKWLERQLIY